jgi:predicted nucleotidyltransferase
MFYDTYSDDLRSKEDLLKIIRSTDFKDIFLKNNINNVLIFGSFIREDFNLESDIDIAIVGRIKLSFNDELELTQKLEKILKRNVDLIDINDEKINNLIKIEALNSKFVVLKDNLLDEAINFYDKLYKENKEFWMMMDKEVLGFE